jgi:alkylation response protein AidB-like acyl-CoA dehydrogenase
MSTPLLDRRDLDFMLYEWLQVTTLTGRPRHAEHSRETFDAVIDLAESIARERFAPINRLLDTEEPRLEGDRVITPAALKPAVKAYCEAGMIGATFDADVGGMQLPSVVFRAAGAYFSSASVSATLAGLTTPNAATLLKHGSAFHRAVIVPPMLEGRWFGTMCLSEPQAGSSLGDITTRALPQPDGSWRLFGNKMWISGGDQDVSENIIHLVLAKIPGPDGKLVPGTRGISLFMVPKIMVREDGSLGERNDVSVAGLNHKLGFRGIPNCLLNFGEGRHPVGGAPGAAGSIVGEPGQGLACMFHMMNDARILIGLVGAALGAGAYQHALAYARTRTQGRLPQGKDPASPPVRLIEHADVRRMLLAQKAYAEGALGLVLLSARLLDEERTARDAAEADRCALLLELLTPVCKSWPAQWCQEGNSLAIQVHGGYGYTRDFPVEQYWRDQRLNPIHEGTHGIQALDLLGRKLRLKDGAAWTALRERIAETTAKARQAGGEWATLAGQLDAIGERLAATVQRLYGCGDLDLTLANASAFLEAFGHHVVAWIWLDQALVAAAALPGASAAAADHYRGKLQAARWFFRWELPRCGPWLDALDALDDTALRMGEAWF